MRKSGMGGFTLMELMVSIVVVGILAAIGYPQYTKYIRETRRSDATINLARIAALQEKFYTECGVYTQNFNGAIFSPVPAIRCTGLGAGPVAGSLTTVDGYYTLTIPVLLPGPAPANVAGGGGYRLSAAPAGGQLPDAANCTTLTIDNTGVKTATGTDGNLTNGGKCWKR